MAFSAPAFSIVPCNANELNWLSGRQNPKLKSYAAGHHKLNENTDLQRRMPMVLQAVKSLGVRSLTRTQVQKEEEKEEEVKRLTRRLLLAVDGTERGSKSTSEERSIIEEAQIDLERYGGETLVSKISPDGHGEQGLDRLDGLWRLVYSTASDVTGILKAPDASPFPFLQVGDIFQRFECKGRQDGAGVVKNIVRFSIPPFLQEKEGITLTVSADFSVRSPRSIALRFDSASFGDVRISPTVESFLAPALLPRGMLPMQLLQFIRGLNVAFPLLTPSSLPNAASLSSSSSVNTYLLTFVGKDVLVGRAVVSGGSFIFQRSVEDLGL